MPIFRWDFHSGHKVPLTETDDISNKAITIAKLGDDVISWIQDIARNTVLSLAETIERIIERLGNAEHAIEELQNTSSCNCPHIIKITQAEYDALTTYERGAIYFIVEPEFWRFGDGLPMILGGYGTSLGDPLPILLN